MDSPDALRRRLLRAADTGDVDAVRSVLATGQADADAIDEHGRTVLSVAAARGHVAIVDALLATACNVEARCFDRWTALGCAMSEGHTQVLGRLLAAGASTTAAVNGSGDSALVCAAAFNRLDIMDVLIAARISVDAVRPTQAARDSALKKACRENQRDAVEKLMYAGADALHVDGYGNSALGIAARWGFEDIVKVLLRHSTSWDYAHGLSCAIQAGHTQIARTLVAAGADVSQAHSLPPLVLAAKHNRAEIVCMLLAAGADVNATTSRGDTALIIAASEGYTSVVEILLELPDLKIEHANNDGDTALLCAANRIGVDAFHLLLAAGANEHHVNKEGETALIYACDHGQIRLVQTLMARGVALDAATRSGGTALSFASRRGSVPIVEMLLATGMVDVNRVDRTGDSALTIAVRSHRWTVVPILIAHGAHVNPTGDYETTAIILATAASAADVATSLLRAGADDQLTDRRGYTPFLRAAENGNTCVMAALLDLGCVDQTATNALGKSAMVLAREIRGVDMVEWLKVHTTVDTDIPGGND